MLEYLGAKIAWPLADSVMRRIGRDGVTLARVQSNDSLELLGTDYGGWTVPVSALNADSICYCVGCGEDISFDLELIERVGCTVHGFDPTPRAIEYVGRLTAGNPRYEFHPVGLWDGKDVLKFYPPRNAASVSHSLLNLGRTSEYIEVPVERLSRLMAANGHSRLDLLKLDIEGAEYRVLDSILEDDVDVKILCLEYDELHRPVDHRFRRRVADSIRQVLGAGYSMVCSDEGNYTFVKGE